MPNAKYNCDFFIHRHVRDYDEVSLHPGIGGFPDLNDMYEFEEIN